MSPERIIVYKSPYINLFLIHKTTGWFPLFIAVVLVSLGSKKGARTSVPFLVYNLWIICEYRNWYFFYGAIQ